MNYINVFSQIILSWWPWISLWSDLWLLQFCIIYLFFLLLFSNNVYYLLLYLFLELFYFGLFLALIQMELFTGFLWVLECTVIFIAVLLLFYLNYTGYEKKRKNLTQYYYYSLFFIIILFNYDYPSEFENYIPIELNLYDLWDDFYESLYNPQMNDFMGLFLSYYYLNSFEFLLVGFLLLIGSVACVMLFKSNKINRVLNYDFFFKVFNFFIDFVDYLFIRKQNLMRQNNAIPATKIFKKK